MSIKVIILNGQGASGKDSFKNFIKEYDKELTGLDRIADTSIIDRTKAIAQMCGWTGAKEDKDRAFLHNLKILLQEYNDLPYKTVVSFIQQTAAVSIDGELVYPYVFVDAREITDIERFVKDFDTTTILIKRGERVFGNEADDEVLNWQYDYIIDNAGTLEDLQAAAQFFWKEFTKPERIEKALSWEEFEVENLKLLEKEI